MSKVTYKFDSLADVVKYLRAEADKHQIAGESPVLTQKVRTRLGGTAYGLNDAAHILEGSNMVALVDGMKCDVCGSTNVVNTLLSQNT